MPSTWFETPVPRRGAQRPAPRLPSATALDRRAVIYCHRKLQALRITGLPSNPGKTILSASASQWRIWTLGTGTTPQPSQWQSNSVAVNSNLGFRWWVILHNSTVERILRSWAGPPGIIALSRKGRLKTDRSRTIAAGRRLRRLPHFPQNLPGGHELLYRCGGGNGATIVTALGVCGLVDAFNAVAAQRHEPGLKF
jgi:hypothetical protein